MKYIEGEVPFPEVIAELERQFESLDTKKRTPEAAGAEGHYPPPYFFFTWWPSLGPVPRLWH